MTKREIFDMKIKNIIDKEEPYAILLIGSGADIDNLDFEGLNDIDLFTVVKENINFKREVTEIDGVKFDISYISIKLLKKGMLERWPFIIKSLKKYKYIYKIDDTIDNLLTDIDLIYKRGPVRIKDSERRLIRFNLYHSYEDILARKEDELNVLFLANNLFKDTLVSYFKLNDLWIPKDKKILPTIEKFDKRLFDFCKEFLGENNIENKLKIINKIMDYVLLPHGGVLKYWNKDEFPLR